MGFSEGEDGRNPNGGGNAFRAAEGVGRERGEQKRRRH